MEAPGSIDEQIVQRLQRAEDRAAITEVLYRMCSTMDRGKSEEWVDLFTEDGKWVYYIAGTSEPMMVKNGHDELRAFVEGAVAGNPTHNLKHLIANPIVDLEGDDATVHSDYFTFFQGDGDGFITRTTGRYTDQMVRCPDGKWRITHRKIELDMGWRPQS